VSVILGGAGSKAAAGPATARDLGSYTAIEVQEAAEALSDAKSVIIVPGYGLAVAKAQFAIAEIAESLRSKGVTVRFGIHPVVSELNVFVSRHQ
jgi:NAD(P) transhydrogenase subunit beta